MSAVSRYSLTTSHPKFSHIQCFCTLKCNFLYLNWKVISIGDLLETKPQGEWWWQLNFTQNPKLRLFEPRQWKSRLTESKILRWYRFQIRSAFFTCKRLRKSDPELTSAILNSNAQPAFWLHNGQNKFHISYVIFLEHIIFQIHPSQPKPVC